MSESKITEIRKFISFLRHRKIVQMTQNIVCIKGKYATCKIFLFIVIKKLL